MGRTHEYLPHASVSRPVETRHYFPLHFTKLFGIQFVEVVTAKFTNNFHIISHCWKLLLSYITGPGGPRQLNTDYVLLLPARFVDLNIMEDPFSDINGEILFTYILSPEYWYDCLKHVPSVLSVSKFVFVCAFSTAWILIESQVII
jgi:hypothetical protein